MYNNIPTQVRTREIRLSYANLNTPRAAMAGADPKYSVTLLFPKQNANLMQDPGMADIITSIEAAATASQNKLWNGYRPPNIFSIIHDGDGVKEKTGQPYGEECKGCWVLNASSGQKPRVVHQSNIKVDLDPNDVYSGMYGQVMLNFYGTSKGGNKVCCGLGPIMKTKDGDRLSGGISPEDAFADVGGAPQQTYAPAQTYTPPATPQYPTGNVTINPLTGQPV